MLRKAIWAVVLGLTANMFALLPVGYADEHEAQGTRVATGQMVTAAAAPGSEVLRLHTDLRSDTNADAANAVTTALSSDGSTLLILTSGSNNSFYKDDGTPILWDILDPATGQPNGKTTSNAEWVFVYDLSGPVPVEKQKINLPVTYNGLIWDKSGTRFYVSGELTTLSIRSKKLVPIPAGRSVHGAEHRWATRQHARRAAMQSFGLAPTAVVAGLGLSSDGSTLYSANFGNDSVSLVNTTSRQVTGHVVFAAPGDSKGTGEYPFWIVVRQGKGKQPDKVLVTSRRDGQVIVFDHPPAFRVIKVGSEPNKMLLSADGHQLYVANGDSDSVWVIDIDGFHPFFRHLASDKPAVLMEDATTPAGLALIQLSLSAARVRNARL